MELLLEAPVFIAPAHNFVFPIIAGLIGGFGIIALGANIVTLIERKKTHDYQTRWARKFRFLPQVLLLAGIAGILGCIGLYNLSMGEVEYKERTLSIWLEEHYPNTGLSDHAHDLLANRTVQADGEDWALVGSQWSGEYRVFQPAEPSGH